MNLAFLSLFSLSLSIAALKLQGIWSRLRKDERERKMIFVQCQCCCAVCCLLLSILLRIFLVPSRALFGSIAPFYCKESQKTVFSVRPVMNCVSSFFLSPRNRANSTCAPAAPAVSKQAGGKSTFFLVVPLAYSSLLFSFGWPVHWFIRAPG